jgi:hypothetical protein
MTTSQERLVYIANHWLDVPYKKRCVLLFVAWRWLLRRHVRKFL